MFRSNNSPVGGNGQYEELNDDLEYMTIKIKDSTYLILTYTNKKLSFIVSIFNILLIDEKVCKEDIIAAGKNDGYKYIIRAIGRRFRALHGMEYRMRNGVKIKLPEFNQYLLQSCLNDHRVNCNFTSADRVDKCLSKQILSILNISLFHTWLPDRENLLHIFNNCDQLVKLFNDKKIKVFDNYADQIYIRDFLTGDMLFGVTRAGLKSLDEKFGTTGSAIYYLNGYFEIIFRYNGLLLIIETNRANKVNAAAIFKTVGLKHEQIIYNKDFVAITKDGAVEGLVTKCTQSFLFPKFFESEPRVVEIKKYSEHKFEEEESLVCQLLNKYHKKKKSQPQTGSIKKSQGVRNLMPFLTLPTENKPDQPFFNFSSSLLEEVKMKEEKKTENKAEEINSWNPIYKYYPNQPYTTLSYSWPPYYWYLQSGNPNPYYVYNVLIENPNYWTSKDQLSKIDEEFKKEQEKMAKQDDALDKQKDNPESKGWRPEFRQFVDYEPKPQKLTTTEINDQIFAPELLENANDDNLEQNDPAASVEMSEQEDKSRDLPMYLQHEIASTLSGRLMKDAKVGMDKVLNLKGSVTWRKRMGSQTWEEFLREDPKFFELCKNNVKYFTSQRNNL